MSFTDIRQADSIGYNPNSSIGLNADESRPLLSRNLCSSQKKTLQSLASGSNIPFVQRYEDFRTESAINSQFGNGIPESHPSSVLMLEKSLQSVDYCYGESSQRENKVINFQYLYDEHPTNRVFTDDNNESLASSDSIAVHSADDPSDRSNTSVFTSTPPTREEDICQTIPKRIRSDSPGSEILESYFQDMQGINGEENYTTLDGNKSVPVSEAEFRDENTHCASSGEKQRHYAKRPFCGRSYDERSRNPSQAARSTESRERNENDEVKGKKNGDAPHSRRSDAGCVVEQAEILHPEASFQQTDFVLKFGRSEHAGKSNLDQVNSMLIAADDRNGGCTRESLLSRDIDRTSCSSDVLTPKSSPSLPSVAENYMSPDHQANTARRSSAQSHFRGEMQSHRGEKEPGVRDTGSHLKEMTNGHTTEISNDKSEDAQIINIFTNESSSANKHGEIRRESQDSDASKSGERDSMVEGLQNGDSVGSGDGNDEHSTLGKHIYPWMKETRQNTRRKQSTSSNSSSNGDKSSKRERTAYTNAQLVELEKEFHFNRYLCRPRRIEMAQMLHLTERQIKIWFQNRRMKYKKDQKMKSIPVGREGFYHPHHHAPNIISDSLLSRNNDHRHYPHAGHFHPGENSYRSLGTEGTGSAPGGMECSTGSRCYHGHRHHGSHVNQDSGIGCQHSRPHGAINSFEGKSYQTSNHKNGSNSGLRSPSSTSSNGTLSPGNGRSSAFGSDVGMRSTSSTGSDAQNLSQVGCGFLSHAISPQQTTNNLIEDEAVAIREKSVTSSESRPVLNQTEYDIPFPGHGFSAFHRHMDDVATRMPFSNSSQSFGTPMSGPNHYIRGYDRPKESSAVPMLPDVSTTVVGGNRRYTQFHNPLESLSDCVQRSPREFQNHANQFGNEMSAVRHPSSEVFSGAFMSGHCSASDRNRFNRSLDQSPLDFSKSKSSSPRMPPSDVYLNNRLTHL